MRRLPPPITVVAKAGEKKCLMPWVLRRSYEDGGRLVLREVEVKHQEYLKASREGGRLTLKIIHVEPPLLPATELPENDGGGPPPAWPSSILSSMAALSSSSPEAMACHEDPRPRSIFNPVAAVHS
ncbi:unnamed protein product [Spirodela intermedia]|uniref:FAF domain-containing protein n=2 Tax=Spirodela intermedia TaxID=51605 RepID=A0A7I8KXN0_SPIIN|nr:unnamed protein product [Spirodela intermedia]CAA6665086.1 unnamed protein product [Spirodela intermedia]CAA7401745.1 unnamed protein product [Spirodela intermedia]